MLFTSAELVTQFQDYNARHGIDVASMRPGKRWHDRQDCHWPVPKCLGGTKMIPLLKSQHILVDLAVSEEMQKECFFTGQAKALMRQLPAWMDAETADFFQWLYLKWAGDNGKGKAAYRDPKTGATARLTPQEALDRGWVFVHVGLKKEAVECPVCGKFTAHPGPSWHFDNCVEKEGSWNWFKEQLKEADPTWRKTPRGDWTQRPARAGGHQERQTCPHCGKAASPSVFKRVHGDNCVEREGSWRWFVEQIKVADPTWRKTPNGRWTQRSEQKVKSQAQ